MSLWKLRQSTKSSENSHFYKNIRQDALEGGHFWEKLTKDPVWSLCEMSAVRHFRWCKCLHWANREAQQYSRGAAWEKVTVRYSALKRWQEKPQRPHGSQIKVWRGVRRVGVERVRQQRELWALKELSPVSWTDTPCAISIWWSVQYIHKLQVNLSSMGCLSLCFLPFPRMPCINNRREHAWTCHIQLWAVPSSSPSSKDA